MTKLPTFSIFKSILFTLLSLCIFMPAQAQDEERDSMRLEEVIVNATRRETDLQTTPVAVTALGAEEIVNLFAHDIGEVALLTPNFSAAKATGFNSAGFAMRGASQTDVLVYWEPPVGVLIDDFVVPHAQTQLFAPYDLESVEVLRGPQGTLFGKNTSAGVVNVRTKRPQMNEWGFDGSMRIGSYGRQEGTAAFNVPISNDTLAFRFAALSQNSDGYYKNGKVSPGQQAPPDGRDMGGDDVLAARAKLLWTPNEDVSVLFQYEYLKDRSDSPPAVNETHPESPQAWNFIGFPGITGGEPLYQAGVSFRDDGLNIEGGHQIDIDGFYMNIDWDFDNYTLASVTGFRDQKSRLPSTYTGETYASLFDATRDDNRETFQQEFRLSSKREGPMNFVTGVFYQTDETSFNVLQFLGLLDIFGIGVPGILDNDNPLVITNNQDMESIGVFFDMNYEINETWAFAAGIRYTHEEKDFFSRPGTPIVLYGESPATWPFDPNDTSKYPCGGFTPCQTDSVEFDEPTYRIMLSNQINDDLFAYGSFAHGFKSGGYSDQAGSGLQVPLARTRYDPEESDSLEFGLKSDLLGGRARLNAAVFYVNYTDMQRAVLATSGGFQETVVFNAAEVSAFGMELEGSAVLTDTLTLRGNIGFLDATYDSFTLDLNLDGDVTPDLDLGGRTVTRAPDTTLGIDITYSDTLLSGASIRAMAGLYHEDKSTNYYAADGPKFDTELESRTLFNANATYAPAVGNWYVSVFAKNITDERYKSASQYVGGLWTFSTYAPPRTYGIEFGVKM